MIVHIYVNDVLIKASKNMKLIQDFEKNILTKLEMKNIGKASFYLRIKMKQQ